MQKQLILVLGVLLGSCLHANGQSLTARLDLTQDLMQKRSGPGMTLRAASSRGLPLPTVMPSHSIPESPARLPVVLAVVNYQNSNLNLPPRLRVERTQTPFIRQVRVSLAQLWGGRLRLDGFANEVSMKNLLDGPSSPGHPKLMQPRAARDYGVSISFRFGRDASLNRDKRCGFLAILRACKHGDAGRTQVSEPL